MRSKAKKVVEDLNPSSIDRRIEDLKNEMKLAAKDLKFEARG